MKKIKKRLLVTITSVFLVSTAFMGVFDYESHISQFEESLKDMAKNESTLFQTVWPMRKALPGLMPASDGWRLTLSKPFAERNRKKLLAASGPRFSTELKQSNNITHMYFIEPDGTVFLRVHQPEQHGDKLRRATFKKAGRPGKPPAALKWRKLFFPGIVRPVFYQGKMIGYLEVAEEIDHVFNHMKAITGNDFTLFLAEDFLNGYYMDFHTEKVGKFAILYPINKDVSLRLARNSHDAMQQALKKPAVSIVDLNGAKYAVGMGPIQMPSALLPGYCFPRWRLPPILRHVARNQRHHWHIRRHLSRQHRMVLFFAQKESCPLQYSQRSHCYGKQDRGPFQAVGCQYG